MAKEQQSGAVQFLHELPEDHPDRNRPVKGFFYRNRDAKAWREVMPSFKIAGCTYNQLAPVWTSNDVWAVSRPV